MNVQIDENTKIIAKDMDDDIYIAVINPMATFRDIKEKGVVIDCEGNIISPILPIGVLSKGGEWLPVDQLFGDISKKKR